MNRKQQKIRRKWCDAAWIALAVFFISTAGGKILHAKPKKPKLNIFSALYFLTSQMGQSGMIDSFVEDYQDYAYTYDNALAAMAFIAAGDLNSARIVLDAFHAAGPEPEGGFVHRYRASNGSPYGILAAGHNAYLLQAFNLYFYETGDSTYRQTAEAIGEYLLSLQDYDGGLFGKSNVTWKSTENNLAAFSALYNYGGLEARWDFTSQAQLIYDFLVSECWDGMRFLCGENDPMVVTDVQALGALILGQDFSNGAYWIEADTMTTLKLKGRTFITGFDLNDDRDTVWTEGTIQEALAFLTTGDFSRYQEFMGEVEKLWNGSGGFQEASHEGTTGFGYEFHTWQATAPTAWYIIAYYQRNVLGLLFGY